jgi:hypothetical protein
VAGTSAELLPVSLVGIVGSAKVLTPTVEGVGAPRSVIAALVLLPERLAAFRAS